MSVSELTIALTHTFARPFLRMDAEFISAYAFSTHLYLRRKRAIFIVAGFVLVLALAHLYIAGAIASFEHKYVALSGILSEESAMLQRAEHVALSQGVLFSQEYFLEHGYEQSSAISNVIITGNNVAQNTKSFFYQ